MYARIMGFQSVNRCKVSRVKVVLVGDSKYSYSALEPDIKIRHGTF